jgi:hypothetical protein
MASGTTRNGLFIVTLLGLSLLTTAQPVHARFARPTLKQIPIQRLIDNLSAKVKEAPEDAKLRRNLARAHVMAFANKGMDVQISGGGPNAANLWFGYTPKYIPFTVRAADTEEQKKNAKQQLAAALKQYQAALKLAPTDNVTKLGLAWALEQAGKKEDAIKLYRETIETAWESEGKARHGRMGGHYITVEAGGYLIYLLDAEKDAKEITELGQRATTLQALPHPVTPIAIPLEAGLTERDIHDRTARVKFDADGTGLPNRWTWINNKAGWLVYDVNGHGQIDSATQLFGSATFMMFWENGYDALSSLDDNQDGKIEAAELTHLAIWRDANSNGISEQGEVKPLAYYNIRQLRCDYKRDNNGILFSPSGVVFADGSHRPTFDIIVEPRNN